jgi:radical SAM superfamily enzyme YgiQ (UPF0313 family)
MIRRLINNPLFRPPAEADSLILQIDEGCPYNRCTFCGMYRDVKFRRKNSQEIRLIIEQEAAYAPEMRRVFLADGDVMRRPFEDLQLMLAELSAHLPNLARVNTYATGKAIIEKTEQQLRSLRSLKLNTLYMGLESGDEETLRRVNKAETAEQMVVACMRAQECGLKMSVMFLLGLGGIERRREHAEATALALNRIQPRLLSALRVVPVPGTELYDDDVKTGKFVQLTECEVVQELRTVVSLLELNNTVFRANHASNIVPIEARFPRDKIRLLGELDALLATEALDKLTPGAMPMWL